jgi:hypothetical protein
MPEVVCEEKTLLLAKYRAATSALFIAVTNLGSKTGVEFFEALAVSKAARAECARARRAVRDHKVLHGC